MTHPAWKRSYAVKAARARKALTEREVCKRLQIPVWTLRAWVKDAKKAGQL